MVIISYFKNRGINKIIMKEGCSLQGMSPVPQFINPTLSNCILFYAKWCLIDIEDL